MKVTEKQVRLLEGKVLASQIQKEIREFVDACAARKAERPCLRVIQAGANSSADWYIGQQEKLAAKLGIGFEKIASAEVPGEKELIRQIAGANQTAGVHGIFITMPLPAGYDADAILLGLDPKKDVEGIHPVNLGLLVLRKGKMIPPTAYAALKLIESTGVALRGKNAALIGQSAIVGRPLQLLLGERRVTTSVCNTGTPDERIRRIVSESDLVIACAGQPEFVRGEWIKPGAIVIDIGTTEVNGRLVGDVHFESAKTRAGYLTPVPGGVGPLTVTMLMQNLIHAYQWQKGL